MSDPRVDNVGPDRLPSDPVTPYVGKRARRDVAPEQQPEQQPAAPYVGRRAARPVAAEPVTPVVPTLPATPYVGRRIARPAVELPAEIAAAPTPETVVEQLPQPVVEHVVQPVVEHVVQPVVEPVVEPAPEAAVAFVKPVAPVALLDVPAPRRSTEWSDWNLFAAESPEDTGQLPFALTEAFTGSLPRIEGEPGTDFSFDTTTALPAVKAGKRARVASRRTRRLLPSLPALVGVAALGVAGFGALTAGHDDLVRVEAGQLRQAGALTGTSGVGTVGDRSVSVSRGGGRTNAAESAAKRREAALAKIGKQQAGWSQELRKNMWQLPVAPGAYHLTAGFGDYGLWAHLHTGLDFAAPTGTPIRAISNGVISSAQFDGAYGNKTVETLEDGTELWYCHQVQFNVSPGDEVRAGDIIGYVGSTGHVTGPHVHIEVRPGGGDPVDPYPALVEHGLQP